MEIQRFETGTRMSRVVVHNQTVYLAGHAPARACGEARLARPELKVELIVTAAARGYETSTA